MVRVSPEATYALAEELGLQMLMDLEATVPGHWSDNIRRGIITMTAPKPTSTGGWVVGIGNLAILHRMKAPPYTISDFLSWYRRQAERRKIEKRRVVEVEKERAAEVRFTTRHIKRLDARVGKIWTRINYLEKRLDTLKRRISAKEVQIQQKKLVGRPDSKLLDRWQKQKEAMEKRRSELTWEIKLQRDILERAHRERELYPED